MTSRPSRRLRSRRALPLRMAGCKLRNISSQRAVSSVRNSSGGKCRVRRVNARLKGFMTSLPGDREIHRKPDALGECRQRLRLLAGDPRDLLGDSFEGESHTLELQHFGLEPAGCATPSRMRLAAAASRARRHRAAASLIELTPVAIPLRLTVPTPPRQTAAISRWRSNAARSVGPLLTASRYPRTARKRARQFRYASPSAT